MSYADLSPEIEEESNETVVSPSVAALHERMDALEKQVAKLRGLVFAFKPKKGQG